MASCNQLQDFITDLITKTPDHLDAAKSKENSRDSRPLHATKVRFPVDPLLSASYTADLDSLWNTHFETSPNPGTNLNFDTDKYPHPDP